MWSSKLNENRGLYPTLRQVKIPVFTPKKQFLCNPLHRTTRKNPLYICHALKQDDSTNYSSKLKIWKTCCRYGCFLFIPPVWTMCACAHELSNSLIQWTVFPLLKLTWRVNLSNLPHLLWIEGSFVTYWTKREFGKCECIFREVWEGKAWYNSFWRSIRMY